ncbi:hypothetical protein GA0115242_121438 [Streptomyces sp. SolWspMP-5a-2]|jgi:hypothetical protein|nr:hypothetical protein GA0115242_121438 [Streptomyces sp. SolWspMP-5a-2]
MSKANGTAAAESVAEPKENTMSFHKIAPVKKARQAAPAARPVAERKPAPKKSPRRRPVGHK